MRLELEQLKAMDDDDLRMHWSRGFFPFESMNTCSKCLTEHAEFKGDKNYSCDHDAMAEEILRLSRNFVHRPSGAELREHLEQLYALRLFYDSFYPQETPTPESSNAVPAKQESAELEANQ